MLTECRFNMLRFSSLQVYHCHLLNGALSLVVSSFSVYSPKQGTIKIEYHPDEFAKLWTINDGAYINTKEAGTAGLKMVHGKRRISFQLESLAF